MKFDIDYPDLPEAHADRVMYLLKTLELGEERGYPSLTLTFSMSKDQVSNLLRWLRLCVENSNESGEDPYDALIESDGPYAIKFLGNISTVLERLSGLMISTVHVDMLYSLPAVSAYLESSKVWYANCLGAIVQHKSMPFTVHDSACVGLQDAGLFSNKKRKFDEQEANYNYQCNVVFEEPLSVSEEVDALRHRSYWGCE